MERLQCHTNKCSTAFTGDSGLHFDTSHLSGFTLQAAQSGLRQPGLEMVRCCQLEENDMYHFRVIETVGINLCDPASDSPYRTPRCSCKTAMTGTLCKHIWWLVDQVLQYHRPPDPQNVNIIQVNQTERSGHSISILKPDGARLSTSLFHLLEGAGLDRLAENWECPVQEGTEEAKDQLRLESEDLLSIFEPQGRLPPEFHTIELAGEATLSR